MEIKHTTLNSKLNLIREDFREFKNHWLGKQINVPMTRVEKENVYQDFYDFLARWEIDLEFRFVFKENSITLRPIGIINELALLTIIGEE